MEVNVSIHNADKPIAIMQIIGEVDGSNYLDLVTKAQELYGNRLKNLILDLSGVTDISSTGLVALHQISLIYGGSEHNLEEDGTELDPDITHSSSARRHVKLVGPPPAVDEALEAAGLKLFFKVFGDVDSAINSFQ